MILGTPIPFREAIRRNSIRQVMPTSLGTPELQQLDAEITRNSFFSARNTLADFLLEAKARVESIINPTEVTRADGTQVLEGDSIATARRDLKDLIQSLGYQPDPDKRGTIEDLSSNQRIELVVRTNAQIAQGYGQWRQGQDPDVLDQWPAQELIRAEARKDERDWATRWLAAARAAGDGEAITAYGTTGRMVARKDSAVWQALGDGAGGYDSDALHNPYPPFAFNSGMDVQDVDRQDAVELGLLEENDQVVPQDQAFGADPWES